MEKAREVASLDRAILQDVARMFEVLAEPTRLQLLQALVLGPKTVGELVNALSAKQANISKQLGVLHHAKLVSRERDGMVVRYTCTEPMVFELCGLVCSKLRRDAQARIASLDPRPRKR